ncbi:protein-L-isoaspartate O-methyltransferase family protein [Methylocapsa aurea]|uniref:protein-L-isoaspartate O-methyltransferase family protein n=1 Tax=Methylocapsa aurea TaxID=663610 RepID=UPI000562B9A0|nr:protein-L-isoaspartate O-methyltransferase [Methylocapsa aurea]
MSIQDASSADFSSHSRRTMVDCQIRTFDVTDQALLARLLEVPREQFLPADLAPLAYSDAALRVKGEPGEKPRTLLPPLVLARLIQGAGVRSGDKVLDIASGTGYSAALFAGLAGAVVALESDRVLFEMTRANLDRFGLERVRAIMAPLAEGAPKEAPFDIIFINGAVEANFKSLFAQLKEGGRLLAVLRLPEDPAGGAGKAICYEKVAGETGYRVLFSASAPVLDAFRAAGEFTFA